MVRIEKFDRNVIKLLNHSLKLLKVYAISATERLFYSACTSRQHYAISGLAVGCFLRSECNKGKRLFISPQRFSGTPSVHVVKFPLSRDQLLLSRSIRMQMRAIGPVRQIDL